jgi:hypothetical protein
MMASVMASKTNWMLVVSVAQVMCVYTSLAGVLLRSSNCAWIYVDASW